MKFCLYEIRKQLTGKLMWGILALLLLLNMAFCYYVIGNRSGIDILPAMKAADKAYQDDQASVLEAYYLYKDEYEAYKEAVQAWIDSKRGPNRGETVVEEPEDPNIPSTYFEGWNDYELIDAYLKRVLSDEEYREQIDSDMDTAVRTLLSYRVNGYDTDSYVYRYLLRYVEVYTNARDTVKIEEGYAYGWDILFAYSGTGLFIILAALFIGGRLFITERDSGMHLLLRTTRRGRGRQAAVKLFSAFLLAVLITLLFTFSSMAVIGWRVGFSSPFNSVQQIDAMFYCPYPLNMLTCLLLTMGVTVLAAYAICLLTAGCSLIYRRSLGAMLTAAVLVGGFYYQFHYGNPNFGKYVNIFTAASAEILVGQWRAVHVGSHPVSQLILLAILLFCLLSLFAVAGWIIWSKWGIGVSSSKAGRLPEKIARIAEKLPHLNIRPLSIAACERRKNLSLILSLLCILLIGLKIFLSVSAFDGQLTYLDETKLLYMEQYKEMTLAETYEAVSERLNYYTEISSEAYVNAMAVKRINDEITREEYIAYRNELNDARTYTKTLTSFKGELEYLIEKEAETGISAKPVFSTGVQRLLDSDFEAILIIIFLLLYCGVYAKEYESNFMPLLRSTKRGRNQVFLTKAALVTGISIILSLVFTLIDMGLAFANYDMACVDSPLFTVTTYSNTASGLTVGHYLILLVILRMLAYTLFGLLIASLSGCLRSEWTAAGATLLLFIPYLLNGLGLNLFEVVDVTAMLSADRLYLLSTKWGGLGGLVFIMLAWGAVMLLLISRAYKRFCK